MTRSLVTTALLLAACNPYDELPQPRCRSEAHCLPGHECLQGRCAAPMNAEIVVAAPAGASGAVHVEILAAPVDDTDPIGSSLSRVVGAREQTVPADARGVAVVRASSLPRLPLWLVAWRGDNDLCEGTPYLVARLPEAEGTTITGSYVARARWRRGCFDPPPRLDYSDRIVFRARSAAPPRAPP